MTPRHALAEIMEEATLVRLAGERAFERGERYWRAGRVSPLEQRDAEVTATVIGTGPYRNAVELIGRVGELLERLGRAGELPGYVDRIRAEHRRKRSLLALLEDLPGSG